MSASITRALERAHPALLTAYAIVVSFTTYFCMYAFRKPFSAASYDELTFLGSAVELKTAFVIAQLLGYTLSKYVGIKVCAEMKRDRRAFWLLALIGIAEASLLLFAVLPEDLKFLAIFGNGIPLGMVWGVVVSYLEGRRTSEMMLAGLSCSFIIASGAVKDVGRWLMSAHDVGPFWMPFATGALFLPLFGLAVWMLDRLPAPSEADVAARSERTEMTGAQRKAFLAQFGPGLGMLILLYFLLTAFRDYRDNYGAEIFEGLGLGAEPAIFTKTELPVAFGIMAVLALLTLVKDNRKGFLACYGIMGFGMILIGVSTAALGAGTISGTQWMILNGLGAYLAYVPYGSVLFDRLMAYTRAPGTAVFAIYVADAVGYTGSIALQLFKDLFAAGTSRLQFFTSYCYVMAVVGVLLFVGSAIYFMNKTVDAGEAPPP